VQICVAARWSAPTLRQSEAKFSFCVNFFFEKCRQGRGEKGALACSSGRDLNYNFPTHFHGCILWTPCIRMVQSGYNPKNKSCKSFPEIIR
jgi:hypothetical protein